MATIASNDTGGGDSNDTATWAGLVVPAYGDIVDVLDDDVITLVGDFECGSGTYPNDSSPYNNAGWSLRLKGTLKASHTVDSSLAVDGLMDYYRSSGTGHSTLDFEDIPENINFEWKLNPRGSFTNSRSYYYSCSLYGNSASRTPSVKISSAYHRRRNTYIEGEVSAGDTTFTVNDATGWKVGDELVLTPRFTGTTQYNTNHEYEVATISAISGTDITVSAGLTYDHGYADTEDYPAAAISNKTSNVQINGYDNSTGTPGLYILRADLKIKDVVGNYLNNIYSLNTDVFRLAHLSIYSTINTVIESNYFQADYSGHSGHLYGILYTNSVYDTYETAEVKDTAIHFIPKTGYRGYYGFDAYYTGRAVKYTDCNGYCSVNYHGSALFNDYQQPARYDNCKAFNSTYGFMLHDNALTTAKNCWSIGCRYATNAYNGINNFVDHHFRFVQYLGTSYAGWMVFSNYIRPDFDAQHLLQTDPEKYFYQNTVPDGNIIKFLDIQKNTAFQMAFYSYGVASRDTTVFATSVASIKFKPIKSDKSLVYETEKYMNAGQTLEVSVQARKESEYNGSFRPTLRIKCSQFDQSVEMTDTDDTWETISVNSSAMTVGEAVTISLETIGTAGHGWFDDLNIEGKVFDIGTDMFSGGTEISNVIDIMDTSKNINITVSPADAEIRIRQGSFTLDHVQNAAGDYTYNYQPDDKPVKITIGKAGYDRQEFSTTLKGQNQNFVIDLDPSVSYV